MFFFIFLQFGLNSNNGLIDDMGIEPYIRMQKTAHKINVPARVLSVFQNVKHLIYNCLRSFFYSLFTILPNQQITILANHNIKKEYIITSRKSLIKRAGYI